MIKVSNTLLLIGCLYFSVCAQSRIDSLIRQRESSTLDTNRVLLSISIATQLWRVNQNEKSLAESTQAYEDAVQLHFQKGQSLALLQEGVVYYRLSEFHKASSLFLRSLSLYKDIPGKKDLALIYHWNGNAYYRLSQYEKSLDYYLKALQLCEEIHDEEG